MSQSVSAESHQGRTLETWTPQQVAAALERKDVLLVDVRTPQEYMNAHIRGTLLAPMSEIDPATFPANAGCQVIFYCGSGQRSEKVAKAYLETGHERVAHMQGGFGAWVKAKLPHMAVDPASGEMVKQNAQ